MFLPQRDTIEKFMRESNAIEGEFPSLKTIRYRGDKNNDKSYHRLGRLNKHDMEAAFWFLAQDTLTQDIVRELHRKLAKERDDLKPQLSNPGDYRKWNLEFPKNTSMWTLLPALMGNYFLDIDKMDAWTAHWKFEKIHPFEDLNGRTGRLIWLHKMLQTGDDWFLKYPFQQMYYYQTLDHQKL